MTITGEEHSAGEGRRQDMQRSPKPAPVGAGPDPLARAGGAVRPGGVGGTAKASTAAGRRRRGPRAVGQR